MKHPALLIDDSLTPTPDRTEAQTQEPADDDFGLIRAIWFSVPASLAILGAGLMGIYLGDFVQWLFF